MTDGENTDTTVDDLAALTAAAESDDESDDDAAEDFAAENAPRPPPAKLLYRGDGKLASPPCARRDVAHRPETSITTTARQADALRSVNCPAGADVEQSAPAHGDMGPGRSSNTTAKQADAHQSVNCPAAADAEQSAPVHGDCPSLGTEVACATAPSSQRPRTTTTDEGTPRPAAAVSATAAGTTAKQADAHQSVNCPAAADAEQSAPVHGDCPSLGTDVECATAPFRKRPRTTTTDEGTPRPAATVSTIAAGTTLPPNTEER